MTTSRIFWALFVLLTLAVGYVYDIGTHSGLGWALVVLDIAALITALISTERNS